MKNVSLFAAACFAVLITVGSAAGQSETDNLILNTESVAERKTRMAWWKEARFGMFVHWGLYSSAEGEWGERKFVRGAEWIQKNANIPADRYENTMRPKFKPSADFATEWAKLAKQAGAKYIVFTNKHHEGFALHDSAQTEFDAKDFTDRDLHQEIVNAVREEGLKVGVYHSLWDWHHPDAPAGNGAVNLPRLQMADRDLPNYVEYLHAQVNEITDGRYGDVDILWLDYSKGPFQGEAWQAKKLVNMVRTNQPNILINNRLWKNTKKQKEELKRFWLGDFSTPEQHIPATGIEGVDWETCDTLNITWGWSKHATNYKSSTQLIQRMIDAVSKGGNYLLNIGPRPDGSIDPKSVERFTAIGDWMAINSEAIYGTQAGPFTRLPWGRATAKPMGDDGYRLYLHVFKWPENGELFVPCLGSLPGGGQVLGGADVGADQLSQTRGGIQITGLPVEPVHTAATVIALDFDQAPEVAPFRVYAAADGTFTLQPADASLKGGAKYHDNEMFNRSNIDSWKANSNARFPLQVETAGRYEVQVELAANNLQGPAEFEIAVGDAKRAFKVKPTGGKKNWKTISAGSLDLPAGPIEFQLACKSIAIAKGGLVRVVTITIQPVE